MATAGDRITRRSVCCAAFAVLYFFGLSRDLTAQSETQNLEGFWIFTVEFYQFDPLLLPPSFSALASCTRDGVCVSSHNLPYLPVSAPVFREGEGHGAWVRTGEGRFLVDVFRIAQRLDNGAQVGFGRARFEITYNHKTKEWAGRFFGEFLAPDGQTVLFGPFLGNVRGVRHRPVPIPTP